MREHKSNPPTDSTPPASSLSTAVALVIAVSMVTATMLGFVRLKSAQIEAGYRIHDLRTRLVTIEQQRAALDVERAALSRPSRLAQIARVDLGLVPADTSSANSARLLPPASTTTTTATVTTSTTPVTH
ncbi:MAG TPA: hypothetical protein VGF99_08950 [Myxococcota bacterium]